MLPRTQFKVISLTTFCLFCSKKNVLLFIQWIKLILFPLECSTMQGIAFMCTLQFLLWHNATRLNNLQSQPEGGSRISRHRGCFHLAGTSKSHQGHYKCGTLMRKGRSYITLMELWVTSEGEHFNVWPIFSDAHRRHNQVLFAMTHSYLLWNINNVLI